MEWTCLLLFLICNSLVLSQSIGDYYQLDSGNGVNIPSSEFEFNQELNSEESYQHEIAHVDADGDQGRRWVLPRQKGFNVYEDQSNVLDHRLRSLRILRNLLKQTAPSVHVAVVTSDPSDFFKLLSHPSHLRRNKLKVRNSRKTERTLFEEYPGLLKIYLPLFENNRKVRAFKKFKRELEE